MTVTTAPIGEDLVYLPRAGTLYDVLDLILDRGMVIDVFVRVSLVGIEILKIDARIVIASVDTYLRFAEAVGRLDLETDPTSRTVPELFGGGMKRAAAKKGAGKAVRSAGERLKDVLVGSQAADDDAADEDEDEYADEREYAADERHERPRRAAADRPRSRSSAKSHAAGREDRRRPQRSSGTRSRAGAGRRGDEDED